MAERKNNGVFWGDALVSSPVEGGTGGFVERDGELYYRIANYHRMPPFFMTVVSGFDHWMFVSSTGGLTCGRKSPDFALFPYTTDDKIHDAESTTGPQTILLVDLGGKTFLWKPFGRDVPVYDIERNLYKNRTGNRLIFEEVNHDLGMAFSYAWTTSDRFGFVRKASLHNAGTGTARIRFLDGLRNLLPSGVDRSLQTGMSTLLDAYKQAEAHPELCAAIYTLSSVPSDRAEPCESLAATVAWSVGLHRARLLLSEGQVAAFCTGCEVSPEAFRRGQRGAFFVESSLTIPGGSGAGWYLVTDVEQGPVQLPGLFARLRQGISVDTLEADVARGTQRLLQLAGGADGCQHSSDRLVTTRHFSNTLFNIMRGGTFDDDYGFPVADFLEFAGSWNRPLRDRIGGLFDGRLKRIDRNEVLQCARAAADADLERLALEYLPLRFSRRHGDPSRPWNHFSIDIRNADGSDRLDYQGNWRDIFQNWEALAISYPEYAESFVAKFVNASTLDGHNPFRVSRAGFDWEVLDPSDPWSNIGYWGDHQVNYLVRLLELSARCHPGRINAWFQEDIFVYANVPYRLRSYPELLADPRHTIEFDYDSAETIAERVAHMGSDGKLVTGPDGSIYRVNLLEKLLLPALTKLGSFVPGGGVWMNTQRPEWNDANNALVGHGLSVVTLCYLRRYLWLLSDLLAGDAAGQYAVSREVLDLFTDLDRLLRKHRGLLDGAISDVDRKRFMDESGAASGHYRNCVYGALSGEKAPLGRTDVLDFLRLAQAYLDHTLGGSRREDGLFHSYNLIHFGDHGYSVEPLQEMLEGQVAVIQSGYLDQGQVLALLDALRSSRLYRSDQNSYMLYPDRRLPSFLEKNVIEPALIEGNAWIESELASNRSRYIARDVDGRVHFGAAFRNVGDLQSALQADPGVGAEQAKRLCGIYEAVFNHRRFTGRSGAMYKYEGLGCIYWHMVSKLGLAVAEVLSAVGRGGADPVLRDRLFEHYVQICDGLGVHKSPARYGAFPADPYSHTPGFAGVQQPGMTGQVKEDIITRFLELGVCVEGGEVSFAPDFLRREEFLSGPGTFVHCVNGEVRQERLEAGMLAFSICGTPVVYRLAESASVRVFGDDDRSDFRAGSNLGEEWSRALFARNGKVLKIEVDVPENDLR